MDKSSGPGDGMGNRAGGAFASVILSLIYFVGSFDESPGDGVAQRTYDPRVYTKRTRTQPTT